MQPPKFFTHRSSGRRVSLIAAAAFVFAAGGFVPRQASAQLLPVSIDTDAATQCGHVVGRADFSEPVALHRGDKRKFRSLRLQYETTARITDGRILTITTNAVPLHYTIAHPQFFYYRPWATPAEFVAFAQLEIPAELPLADITIDTQHGGCASRANSINGIAAMPQMLAEESPVALAPVFPDEMAALNADAATPSKLGKITHANPGKSVAHKFVSRKTPATTMQPTPPAKLTQLSVTKSQTASPSPVAAGRAPVGASTPCTQPDQEPHVVSLTPVNAHDRGKSINDRPTVGRIRVALDANSTVKKAEVAESSGFPLLDKRLRDSALHSTFTTKVQACESIASDYVVRYEIGF